MQKMSQKTRTKNVPGILNSEWLFFFPNLHRTGDHNIWISCSAQSGYFNKHANDL